MRSLWQDQDAKQFQGDLALRVYTSRLLGQDPSLVLHGGGNTSVKIREKNIFGNDEDILYVKGSGWDLETIDVGGFAPVKLQHLLELAKLDRLSDPQMVNELKTHTTKSSAPTPSVEAILHAILPYKFVDHTHADAIVTITNTPNGFEFIKEIFGDSIVIVRYVMPGFDLARQCAMQFAKEATQKTKGMILLNHGIFSFANTARESYETMIELVAKAEEFLQKKKAWDLPAWTARSTSSAQRVDIAKLRRDISVVVGSPVIVIQDDQDKTRYFAQRDDVFVLSQQGPATPDHVIRTKSLPMLGRDVNSYCQNYKKYFDQHAPNAREPKTMLDPAPRVVLDPMLGMLSVGKTAKDAAIVRDIYDHTIDVILRSTQLGGYRALSSQDLFDMEYWDLEQAKLRHSGKPPVFSGEVALVTGAASGIGKACVESLLARGTAVIGLDINADIISLFKRPAFFGIRCDVTDEAQIVDALEQGVRRFGGMDIVVLNAGIFPGGKKIAEISTELWRKVMAVNLDANLVFLRETYPLLKLAPKYGRVVIIGSKNVPAPGPGAVAYSASKAALTQVARIAALEWGGDGIRINLLHPDAVFDTGIWTPDVLAARAQHYGMSVDEYKRKNVLKTEVTSRDVAELVAEMCGPLFAKTTASQLPIDGGNDRVI